MSLNTTLVKNFNEIVVNRVFGTSMVEEYEEIADSQYQSERQELFDEDYGEWFFKSNYLGLPRWSSGWDSAFSMQGAPGSSSGQGTRSHMPQLKDPVCWNKDPAQPNK